MNEPTVISDADILQKLMGKFPESAVEESSDMGGFTAIGIKPQYVIERLNEVFGIFGWDHFIEKDKDGKLMIELKPYTNSKGKEGETVSCYATLEIIQPNMQTGERAILKRISSYGGSRVILGNYADAYKGAKTNALCKAASYLGVAHEAYKGELEIQPKVTQPTITPIQKAKNTLTKFMVAKNISKEKAQELAKKSKDTEEEVDISKWNIKDYEGFMTYLESLYRE